MWFLGGTLCKWHLPSSTKAIERSKPVQLFGRNRRLKQLEEWVRGWLCNYNVIWGGVDSLEIDMDKQKVTVTGCVDERKVLKVVRRTGRKAELWPFPYDSEYYPYASEYLDESTYASSYNYYRHGYNESVHGYFPDQAYSTFPDQTVHLFSDDNVHAYCNVM
ncbi:hypothetical protein CRYUN_Cryun05aG0067600 [Craigia yunnanensis]